MHLVSKTLLAALAGVAVYFFIILPITLPQLRIRRDWPRGELEWREENIIWFIHVTDFHISKYVHPDIEDSLDDFFSTTLDAIQPRVVLASGDLTDGKGRDGVDSFQINEEWSTYAHLLARNGVSKKTLYLDIRGNHDSFDVETLDADDNFHREYSVQGRSNPTSYISTVEFGENRTVSFVAVDATLKPGPKKVFNFLGYLSELEFDELRMEISKLKSDHQIYFGHFPSSCIVSPSPGFRHLIRGGIVYLAGHLHTLGGFAEQLYTVQRDGMLELELGDWKENRRYRVLALDNGLLSFSDTKHGEWPVVVVSNPKAYRFLAPEVEPVQKIRQSTHIRVLAFSPSKVRSVHVRINGGNLQECVASEQTPGLYTAPWHPLNYTAKQNELTVVVTDNDDRTKTVEEMFVVPTLEEEEEGGELEERLPNRFRLSARIILMGDVLSILQFLWVATFLLATVPILIARYCSCRVVMLPCSAATGRALARLVTFSPFFYLYMGISVLVGFGPWHAGQILKGHTGIIFPWTVYVAGHFLPSFYPYVFSFVHLFFFQTPLLWSLVYKFKWRIAETAAHSKVLLALSNIPVTLVLSSQACLLLILYFFPSRLGIFREIAILIFPMEAVTILLGFAANGLVSYAIPRANKRE